ncbi:hypothetical protein GCM10028800_01840 [Nesterenkonia populi]
MIFVKVGSSREAAPCGSSASTEWRVQSGTLRFDLATLPIGLDDVESPLLHRLTDRLGQEERGPRESATSSGSSAQMVRTRRRGLKSTWPGMVGSVGKNVTTFSFRQTSRKSGLSCPLRPARKTIPVRAVRHRQEAACPASDRIAHTWPFIEPSVCRR